MNAGIDYRQLVAESRKQQGLPEAIDDVTLAAAAALLATVPVRGTLSDAA